ncbi:MAG: DMT family transporter [Candidatus Rokubacteria bacterium]|nr:DMT family transporter [Candidatus Rokubacteria bacterium]
MTFLSPQAVGALCALGSAITWAVISLLVRTVSPPLGSVAVSILRSLIGGSLLLVWVLTVGGLATLVAVPPGTLALLAVSVVIAIGVGDVAFFESARHLGLAPAMTVTMTYPLIGAILAAVFLHEPITLAIAAGSLVTLSGLALIVFRRPSDRPREGRTGLGLAAATTASVAWAVSLLLLKPAMGSLDAVTAQAVRLPLAGLVLLATPWGWGAVTQMGRASRGVFLRVAFLGAVTAGSSVLFVTGVKLADVAVAAVLSSTSPLFAIPLGLVFLGERLTARAVLGTLVTVAGLALLQV